MLLTCVPRNQTTRSHFLFASQSLFLLRAKSTFSLLARLLLGTSHGTDHNWFLYIMDDDKKLDFSAEVLALTTADPTEIELASASAAEKVLHSSKCPKALATFNDEVLDLLQKDEFPQYLALRVSSAGDDWAELEDFFFSDEDTASLALALRNSTTSKRNKWFAKGGVGLMVAGLVSFCFPALIPAIIAEELFVILGIGMMGGGAGMYYSKNGAYAVSLKEAQLNSLQLLGELCQDSDLQARFLIEREQGGYHLRLQAKNN